jgi:hypothetical protein
MINAGNIIHDTACIKLTNHQSKNPFLKHTLYLGFSIAL